MRVLVVSNPHATATTASQRDVLVHALASDAKLEVAETANRGHAAALACRAMRDGVDVVVALGGDGTVNEVVNGLLTDGVHDRVPALGIVPAGSTNVFARALGLPNDPVEATSTLIGALAENRRREIGVGQADERWFVFAAGFGYDAAVVGAVETQRRRGRRSTHSLYVRTAVRQFFAQDRRHPAITLTAADGTEIDDLYMALITNCDPWTFLGNRAMSPTPGASFETGLDVYARTRMGTAGILWSVSRMVRRADDAGPRWRPRKRSPLSASEPADAAAPDKSKALKSKSFGARTEHDLTEFILTASRPLPLQVDGDALGERISVRFRGVPRALRVCL